MESRKDSLKIGPRWCRVFVAVLVFSGLISVFWLLHLLRDSAVSPIGFTEPSSDGFIPEDLWVEPDASDTQENWFDVPIQVPLVDREVLQRLAGGSEIDDDDDSLEDRQPWVSEKPHWPPTVTALPESRSPTRSKFKSPSTNLVLTEQTDTQFCGVARCRLLLPLLITEREPKAQVHLVQLLYLATVLNRTLVLPNVGRGRVGTCLRWDFSVYFDIASAVQAGGARVMMMDDFRTWVDMRSQKPTGRIISLDEKSKPDDSNTPSDNDSSGDIFPVMLETARGIREEAGKSARCLKNRFRRLDLETFLPMSVYLPAAKESETSASASYLGPLVVDALALGNNKRDSSPQTSDMRLQEADSGGEAPLQLKDSFSVEPDVLLLHWGVKHHQELFSEASNPAQIEYSPNLLALATKLAAPLTPYLVVHWYMGKAPTDVLPACADALIDTLDILLNDETLAYGIQTVWLSTDYPYLISSWNSSIGMAAKSASAKTASEEHKEAMALVEAAFAPGGELQNWRLTGLEEELSRLNAGEQREDVPILGGIDNEGALQDSGVIDIINKMAALNAALFVSNGKGCGRSRWGLVVHDFHID